MGIRKIDCVKFKSVSVKDKIKINSNMKCLSVKFMHNFIHQVYPRLTLICLQFAIMYIFNQNIICSFGDFIFLLHSFISFRKYDKFVVIQYRSFTLLLSIFPNSKGYNFNLFYEIRERLLFFQSRSVNCTKLRNTLF